MNREIKFRAWDKENKTMLSVARLNFISEEALLFDVDKNCNYWKELCNVKLMQYTGMKDKNGKEIYEGDIIQCTDKKRYGLMYIVSFEDGAFCFNDIEYPILYRIHDFPNLEDLLIVSNIYENEELLKDE